MADALGAIVGLVSAGFGAYSANQQQRAMRAQAQAAQAAAEQTRQATLQQAAALKAQLEGQALANRQQADAYTSQLEQARQQTSALQFQAETAKKTAETQLAGQRQASALSLQQQRLSSQLQTQQSAAAPVTSRVRQRVGTPAGLRTGLELQSPFAGSGLSMGGSASPLGGLNV
jgi:hypothetical protein